jgi:hypothetical protein
MQARANANTHVHAVITFVVRDCTCGGAAHGVLSGLAIGRIGRRFSPCCSGEALGACLGAEHVEWEVGGVSVLLLISMISNMLSRRLFPLEVACQCHHISI